ncbi:c-type cytochrome [Chryseolinea lacunae]|uniref:C-type cytochrome n=1 Tax=Chryseolinea lacunae TaxID=2801331 RepID=A0ABS1L1F4_9BACT|nr:c-type cytochrome [Chryseolinea lacunae]MBL0745525.1 c-type cytochrome [Chryseolinea lacunae]
MSENLSSKKLLLLFCIPLLFAACRNDKSTGTEANADPKLQKLKLQPGFVAEHLYSPSDKEQGSWVAMTFDNKGRLITSDQYGALYRLVLAPVGSDSVMKIEKLEIGKTTAELADTTKPKIQMGYAQGLLYAFNSLYVMVNHDKDENFEKGSGLYRLQDTDGDDQFDKITLLKALEGDGEHGPHSVVLSPDKKSIYMIAGNFTNVPPMDAYRLPHVWQEDNMLPLIKDPRGHANDRTAPGGWIARTDSVGSHWELVGAGYRNPFDFTFNEAGELFAYDSDMEWDFGMPWYRPTRICHVTSGSEYGWRTGDSPWSPDFPDNLPPVINIGQGSPTNLIHGMHAKFPSRYKDALFASDWSFGIIYAIHLKPNGASYTAEPEEFLSGAPLPLTDGAIGPDGALYFLTGGRRLESDLYRVYYKGDGKETAEPAVAVADAGQAARDIRKQLEAYHGAPQKGAVDFAWPYLKNEDRFIRYAARIAVEHQPVAEWQARVLKEKDAQTLIESSIALVHHAKPAVRNALLTALTTIDYKSLSASQQVDLLRAFELILLRMGTPEGAVKTQVIAYLNPHYPANTNTLNRSLSKVLVYLEAPGAIEKTLALLEVAKDDPLVKTASQGADLILRNPQYGMDIANMLANVPPAQQTWYATVLMNAKTGWTPALHDKYFAWFKKAFGYKGGLSYIGFINKARLAALTHVPEKDMEHYNELSGGGLVAQSGNELVKGPEPKGPGRNWKIDEAVSVVEDKSGTRNFEQGKMLFAATRCIACHTMRGEGGTIGPDLTQLGTRFAAKDMLESIIEPSKVVSDQYAATVFTMKDGSSILGRLTNENDAAYFVSQNPFAPETLREIPKQDVVSKKFSYISVMYPGLINSLNEEELKDLVAYLMAGGNGENEVYKNK